MGEIKLNIKKMQSTEISINDDIQNASMLHNMSPFLHCSDITPYSLVYGRYPRWLLNPDMMLESEIGVNNGDAKFYVMFGKKLES